MAIAYLLLNIFFGIRLFVIYLFYGFALIIGICLLIDATKDAATNVCMYFVQTVFFQAIIVLYFSACILIIKALNMPIIGEGLMYVIMLIGSIFLATKLMLGTKVIRWATRTTSNIT